MQININLTPELESALERFMRLRHFRTKSEAVRVAIQEGLERASRAAPVGDFKAWRGLALRAPVNPTPRFPSDETLWE
jgi:hypothetical protein